MSKSTTNRNDKQQCLGSINGQKTLKEVITKKKPIKSNHETIDKENNNVEQHQDNN